VIALIRGEAIKMRSTRTAIGFTVAGVVLTVLFVLVFTLGANPSDPDLKRESLSVARLFVLFVVFGVVGATGEYRHRTVAPAVLIAPDRLRLLGARAVAYAVTAAGVGAVMLAVAFALGIPLMAGNGGPSLALSDYLGLIGGTILIAALGSALGVGFGALVGNQVAAVVSVLVYLFVVNGLIGAADSDLIPYTIGIAVPRLAGIEVEEAFSFPGSLAVLIVWTTVFLAAGLARERGREVT